MNLKEKVFIYLFEHFLFPFHVIGSIDGIPTTYQLLNKRLLNAE